MNFKDKFIIKKAIPIQFETSEYSHDFKKLKIHYTANPVSRLKESRSKCNNIHLKLIMFVIKRNLIINNSKNTF